MPPRSRGRVGPSSAAVGVLVRREGAGKAGCWSHPRSACSKKARGRTTGTAEHPAFPARWLYGLYAISPGTGCLAPVARCARHERRDLDASIGAPGPRDFAVRSSSVVAQKRLTKPRPPHPRLTCRDDRDTPLSAKQDGGNKITDLEVVSINILVFRIYGLRRCRAASVDHMSWPPSNSPLMTTCFPSAPNHRLALATKRVARKLQRHRNPEISRESVEGARPRLRAIERRLSPFSIRL